MKSIRRMEAHAAAPSRRSGGKMTGGGKDRRPKTISKRNRFGRNAWAWSEMGCAFSFFAGRSAAISDAG
jgi:hypothetical protein